MKLNSLFILFSCISFIPSTLLADLHDTTSNETFHYNYDYSSGTMEYVGFQTAPTQNAVFNSSVFTGFGWPTSFYAGIGGESVDWGDFNVPQSSVKVTGFTFGYGTFTQSGGDGGSAEISINFYGSHTSEGVDPLVASFSLEVPGSSSGGSTVYVDLGHEHSFWLGSDFEYGYQIDRNIDGTNAWIGPLLSEQDLINAPGTVDLISGGVEYSFWDDHMAPGQSGGAAGESVFVSQYGQLYMIIHTVPEPSSGLGATCLLVGGLFCRRKKSNRQSAI